MHVMVGKKCTGYAPADRGVRMIVQTQPAYPSLDSLDRCTGVDSAQGSGEIARIYVEGKKNLEVGWMSGVEHDRVSRTRKL